MITDYHAKYFAYDLTRKVPSAENAGGKISTALYDSAVDLNPHQVEAALFALRSPLTKGVILADEVGLGKTIEAGLVLAQFWAEHKRRLLVICPASLRRQWSLELLDKFGLESVILESANFKASKANLADLGKIAITSVQFASRYAKELRAVPWDLAVIDEAHKLRNLYKPDNKMGKAVCEALADRRKILLTATPLQNSLLELYGLAALVDDQLFGNLDSFKAAYIGPKADLDDLKKRLRPYLKRTLRRDVLEYIKYTQREAITQPFSPTEAEQRLYNEVSEFLLRPDSYAIPVAQRALLVLVIRKLLASSSYALIGTLKTIRRRLEDLLTGQDTPLRLHLAESSSEYLAEEMEVQAKPKNRPVDQGKLAVEIETLDGFIALARSIKVETKAKALLTALNVAFARLKELDAAPKALIFTESSRTQRYLKEFLTANGFADRLVTFNGQNDDSECKAIYQEWKNDPQNAMRLTGSLNVDMRQSLVDRFRNQAEIMVATEAGAEGLNLQFCSLVINYDLPWNPQRIEQRIGRVHRYGQKHDVVVVNFLNETNQADQRLYALLKEKFQLFDGVFGASDEILGRLESGLDFEKRILDIFDTCRTPTEIETAFAALQAELETPIEDRLAQSRRLLLESFDEEVHQRLRGGLADTGRKLDDIGHKFWALTKHYYGRNRNLDGRPRYFFNDAELIFGPDEDFVKNGHRDKDNCRTPLYYYVDTGPAPAADLNSTPARTRRKIREGASGSGGRPHRLSGFEGELITSRAKKLTTGPAQLVFDLSGRKGHIGLLEDLKGRTGWFFLDLLSLETFEVTEHLIFNIYDEDGASVNPEAGPLMFQLKAAVEDGFRDFPWPDRREADLEDRIQALNRQAEADNQLYFVEELDKIDRWSDDLKNGLELEIKALNRDIREVDRQLRLQSTLADKLVFQKQKAALEKKRHQKRHELFEAQDEIDRKRRILIEQIEKQMMIATSALERIMICNWSII